MNKKKRFYGMTTTQVAILGGLAATALCIMLVVGFAILATLGEERAAQNTPPLGAASSPEPSATAAATSSPTPQPTPIALPEGWGKFESQGASIWLPPSFIGGDMADQRESTVSLLTSQVKFSEISIQKIKSFNPEVILFMVENRDDINGTFPTVVIYRIPDENKTDLTAVINKIEKTPNVVTLRRKRLNVSGYEAMGIDYEQRDREVANESAYIYQVTTIAVRGKEILWLMVFTSPPETQAETVQVFENSIGTISLP